MTDALIALGSASVQNALATRSHSCLGKGRSDADMTAAAKEFEAMFMGQMLQPMFEGLGTDSMFGGGHGEEMMRGFLVQEYGKAMVQSDHSHLGDALKSELIRLQNQNIASSGDSP